MLGLDVHDCANARSDTYLDGELRPGIVLTVEPGLYFQPDDDLVPEEYRGIGVRIEDDVLVTATGAESCPPACRARPRRWRRGSTPSAPPAPACRAARVRRSGPRPS